MRFLSYIANFLTPYPNSNRDLAHLFSIIFPNYDATSGDKGDLCKESLLFRIIISCQGPWSKTCSSAHWTRCLRSQVGKTWWGQHLAGCWFGIRRWANCGKAIKPYTNTYIIFDSAILLVISLSHLFQFRSKKKRLRCRNPMCFPSVRST